MWGDENVNLAAIATDDDFGIDRVEFFSDENKQGEDLTGSYYSYYWQQPPPGVHSITARAVDRLDTVTISEPITVTVLEDSDLDRMEDGWETTHFLGLQEAPLGDFDQDGASNLHEYEAGTDPTDDTDTPVNIPSVIAFTSPADGATYLEGDDINFHTSFSDADFGAERMVFYADGVEFDTDNSVYSSAFGFWDDPAPGSYTVTAIATDRYGAESPVGTPITVTVLADSDGDRMPDLWETTTFGDLSQAASEDGDGDGFPNIIEYHHGSDGNDPASTPRFAAAQSADSPLADIGAVRYYRVDGVSNTSFEKSSIQTAINAADDFDIIEVLPGVYDESINLSDRIYLFSNAGARTTIIDGGARNDNVVYLATEAVIEGFTIRNGARSWDGGGLYITESTIYDQMRIVGCVIRDNSAGDQGGGVYVSNGRPTFVSCTIAGNRAASGGAVYNTSTSNIITLVNTLLWNPDAPEETAGQTTSIAWDHSLSRDTTSGNVLIDGVDQLTADPGLGYDYSLIAASPARDTGTTALHPALDLDGEALTVGLKDIGADEFNDADADGLPDWVEALGATDAAADSDGDTLNNLAEYETHWTNPNDSDTDGDQLDDGAELTAGTDALDPDTDGDTLPDGWEVNYGLDPLDGTTADADPDGDTLLNSEEFALGTDPTSDDTDGDGLKDNIEGDIFASTDPSNFHYLDPTNPDTDGDGIDDGLDSADGDELSNLDELALGTDPNLADTDADGVNDSVEVALGTDPLTNDDFANQDSDNDGLSDLFEINYGTDPYDADTNDNGMNDGEELDNGGDPRVPGPPPDPLDPNDPPGPDPFPPPPPPIYPGNYDILVESKSISFPKYGHGTFQSTDPAKRYLTLSAQQSFSGGCPESGPKNISGSKTIEIDPITGESTTTGDGFVSTGGTAESPVRKSGESETSSYDDPPNEETDCEGTIHYSSVLSNENTTTMMVTNGKNELEDYEDDFSTWSATPSAYRNVHENELRYDYKKV
ncbi:MAG: Ig-like domain-containing protein, partial [Spirochaetota bacterium]